MPKASKSVNEAEGVVNARDMIAMMILVKTYQSDNAVSIQVNVRLRLTILSLRLKFIGLSTCNRPSARATPCFSFSFSDCKESLSFTMVFSEAKPNNMLYYIGF